MINFYCFCFFFLSLLSVIGVLHSIQKNIKYSMNVWDMNMIGIANTEKVLFVQSSFAIYNLFCCCCSNIRIFFA